MSHFAIAIAMQKGGVGKTTSAVNLAYELMLAGRRVLLVDLDPQGNATSGMGVEIADDDGTLYEVLTPDRSLRMAIADVIKTSSNGIDVAPSDEAMYGLDDSGLGPGGENRLKVALATVTENYDVVIMDCRPSLGPLTISAFAAAHDILAVVSPGPDEISGLVKLAESVYEAQDLLNPDIDIRHLLVTDYDGRTALDKAVKRNLQNDWPDEFLGVVHHTVRVREAKDRSLPIAVHAPGSTAAEDYRDVAQVLNARITARTEGR